MVATSALYKYLILGGNEGRRSPEKLSTWMRSPPGEQQVTRIRNVRLTKTAGFTESSPVKLSSTEVGSVSCKQAKTFW